MEVYLARESKISHLLELEADVERLSRPNSRLIAQIQRLETERNEIAQKLSKNFQRCEQAVPPASQTTIYWIPTPWRKELLLRKIAQVDAILRQKPMSRENRSRESEGLLELTTPVSYQEVNGASAEPASTPNSRTLQGLAGPEIFQRIEAARQLEPS
jgi:uncharacterized coiled-coil DUF342 family protein